MEKIIDDKLKTNPIVGGQHGMFGVRQPKWASMGEGGGVEEFHKLRRMLTNAHRRDVETVV